MENPVNALRQLRADVEAGHEHPSVSLLRLLDLMLEGKGDSQPAPAPVPVQPVDDQGGDQGDGTE